MIPDPGGVVTAELKIGVVPIPIKNLLIDY